MVRLIQTSCALCLALLFFAPARAPGKVDLTLAVLGERELPDGSWEGVDLLAQPGARAQRFQLTVRPERDLRLVLEARAPDGTLQRIFPEPGKEGVLAQRKAYALPGPQAFYALEGEARLVLTASPLRRSAAPVQPVEPGPQSLLPGPTLPLSDGTRVTVQSARLSSGGPLRLELRLSDR